MVELTTLYDAIYNRAYSASAGSSLRAALGGGAASVVVREQLSAGAMPSLACIALAPGPIAFDAEGTAQTHSPRWLIYDKPEMKGARIRSIVPLLVALYTGEGAPVISIATGGQVGHIRVANVGAVTPDRALGGLDVCPVTFQLYTI